MAAAFSERDLDLVSRKEGQWSRRKHISHHFDLDNLHPPSSAHEPMLDPNSDIMDLLDSSDIVASLHLHHLVLIKSIVVSQHDVVSSQIS